MYVHVYVPRCGCMYVCKFTCTYITNILRPEEILNFILHVLSNLRIFEKGFTLSKKFTDLQMADHIALKFFQPSTFLPRLELQWCATTDGFWA